MKVAFDSKIFRMQKYGGISRYIANLTKQLSLLPQIEAKIFSPLHINSYLETLPPDLYFGIKAPTFKGSDFLMRNANKLISNIAIARFKPKIIHETYYSNEIVGPISAKRVITVYDMIHEIFSSEFAVDENTTSLKRLATERADHILCISESTRNDLLEKFDLPENKVSVVYLGFEKMDLIKGIGCKSKPYLLYVGHRGGYKNFEGFLRAFASSVWLRINFNIICFGGGLFTNDEKELFSKLNLSETQCLQVSGNDNKLASLYHDAAIFVYPSLYEGFGIPPLEAMSQNCPVVCSKVSSIPEVVGNAAEYFDPKSYDSIRIAMENVLSSSLRQSELIELGKLRVAMFTWNECAKKTLAVYKELL